MEPEGQPFLHHLTGRDRQINVVNAQLLRAEEMRLGVERARSIVDPFKMLLGPGLIRPLFPGEYFLVWVPSHACFYWWGILLWYANLTFSAPLFLKRPLAFLNKHGGVFTMLVFLALVGGYTLVYISGIGMRKRAMFHFFYTVLATVTYFSPSMEARGVKGFRLPLPVPLLRLAVVIVLMVASVLGVEPVP